MKPIRCASMEISGRRVVARECSRLPIVGAAEVLCLRELPSLSLTCTVLWVTISNGRVEIGADVVRRRDLLMELAELRK